MEHAFAHRLSIVTGGPGTGKTATIKMICAAAQAQKASVLLVAPTGRAARRISESTGIEASTVHSALGWIPGEGPQKHEEDPLRADLLVVDETSMANLELLVTLLRAVGDGMHVVLVGDADQLAPVGAGKPFAELVGVDPDHGAHPHLPAGGGVDDRARRPRGPPGPRAVVRGRGRHAARPVPDRAAGPGGGAGGDRLARPAAWPSTTAWIPSTTCRSSRPSTAARSASTRVNGALREALNPGGRPLLGGRLREGDKVMLSGRNLHDLGLMNGTVLRMLGVREDIVTVAAEGVSVDLPDEDAPALRLAYACSVHKGQGIELPVAVIVAHPAAGAFFLRREMLYTAMTRARLATVIVGTRAVIEGAAAKADTSGRYSRLTARLATAGSPPPG